MMTEDQEEVVVCKDQLQIIKGKRTKRPRPLSPLTSAMASSTTSSGRESGRNSDDSRGFDRTVASPTTSVELAESNEEDDEDMANCLMLLAQGQTRKSPSEPASLATTSKTGILVHQCKTCNRCFPSFQALGGHRASHKKPKVNNNEENNKGLMLVREVDDQFNNMNTTLSLQITNKAVFCNSSKSKVHECSICGAEFSSGQALGGHMRRHRSFTTAATTASPTTTLSVGTRSSPESEDQSKKQRTVLQLDLNLPAPEDDHQREPKFSFASKEKLLVFSASSLVDCHY